MIFEAILNRAPASPLQLNPGLPPQLEVILNKVLEKDRDLRCQTAAELRSDLKRLKRDMELARVDVAGQKASRAMAAALPPAPRERPIVPVFIALALLVGVAAGLLAGKRLWQTAQSAPLYHEITFRRGVILRHGSLLTVKPSCTARLGREIPSRYSLHARGPSNPVLWGSGTPSF